MLSWKNEYHSLAQINLIQEMSQRPQLELREALFLATQLVNHGFHQADAFIRRLSASMPSKPVQDYLARLLKRHRAIQSLAFLRPLQADADAVRQFYAGEGFVFRPGAHRRDTAVVIFTTKFNNFTVSHVVADAMFAELGVSRLFLKDTSEFVFLRGVKGLAEDLAALPEAIGRLLKDNGIARQMLTGYSSGGYPSLFAAAHMDHIGHAGFSVCSDISPSAKAPVPDMYRKLKGRVPDTLFADLGLVLRRRHGGGSIRLFYGQRDAGDSAQALHLEGAPGVEIAGHAEAGHEVTAHLLEEGRFMDVFRDFLSCAERNEASA